SFQRDEQARGVRDDISYRIRRQLGRKSEGPATAATRLPSHSYGGDNRPLLYITDVLCLERYQHTLMSGSTMKKSLESKSVAGDSKGDSSIPAYSQAQPLALRPICDVLRELIDSALPKATSKIWHGSPVWFMDENPVVGYKATAKTVNLLF